MTLHRSRAVAVAAMMTLLVLGGCGKAANKASGPVDLSTTTEAPTTDTTEAVEQQAASSSATQVVVQPSKPAPATTVATDSVEVITTPESEPPYGKYTYDLSGSYTFAGKSQNYPTTTLLGEVPTKRNQWIESTSTDDGKIVQYEEEARSDGNYLLSLKFTDAQKQTIEFKPATPVLALPTPLAQGKSWSWDLKSADGQQSYTAQFQINGQETVTIGGTPVASSIVKMTSTLTDNNSSPPTVTTVTASVWQGQKFHLPVQAKSVTETKVTVPVFHGESSRKLQSVQAQHS